MEGGERKKRREKGGEARRSLGEFGCMCVFVCVCLFVCVCVCAHGCIVVDKVYMCVTLSPPSFSHAHLHTKCTHSHRDCTCRLILFEGSFDRSPLAEDGALLAEHGPLLIGHFLAEDGALLAEDGLLLVGQAHCFFIFLEYSALFLDGE